MALFCETGGLRVSPDEFPEPMIEVPQSTLKEEIAVLAGGCFWCVEAVFLPLDGVLEVSSGYAGGSAESADYKSVCSGGTDHAEAVRVRFDPARIGYGPLLKVFFSIAHDPTQCDGQGNDRGRQYRSAIFYADQAQKTVAQAYIRQLNEAGVFRAPIVTVLEPLNGFYEAEAFHQNYVAQHPDQPYIALVAKPKVDKLKHYFAAQLKDGIQETRLHTGEISMNEPKRSASGYDLTLIGGAQRERLAQQRLSAEERRVLLEHGTERPFCGQLLDNKQTGVYGCRLCGLPLFRSGAKFDSGTGWPSFFEPFDPEHIRSLRDANLGMVRTEIRCARCDGHLGHVFPDGPPPTGQRFCLNSAAMEFFAGEEKAPRQNAVP